MAVFNDTIVRCELFPDFVVANEKFVNVRTSLPPAIYLGAQCEFQFAIFATKATSDDTPATLYDVSQFSGLPKMRVRLANASGTILMDDTVASAVQVDPTLTLATWQDGTKWHFRFAFEVAATGLPVGVQFLVIYGPDGDVFGVSTVEVIDPGTGAGASPTPSADGYFTKTEVNGKLGDKLDKQFAIDQPLVLYAKNQTTSQIGRITLQPTWDDQGLRLVPINEDVTNG